MFHRKKVSPDSKTEKPILQSTEKQIKGFILIIRFSSYHDYHIHGSRVIFSHRVLTL